MSALVPVPVQSSGSGQRLRAEPDTPHSRYDLVVVGAGIGGLTAAALAARAGARVLVQEAHNRPGGCAGDFALGGLLFPAGATLLSGFEAGGLHDLIYRRLGLENRAVPLARAMAVVAPDSRFTFWTDRTRWDHEWRATFPGDAAAKARFFAWVETVGGAVHRMAARLPVLPPRHPRDLARLTAAFRLEMLRTLPHLVQNAGDVLRATGADRDPRFRRFIDAQLLDATGCTSDTCAAVNAAIALDLYHRGCFALPGGSAEIAHDLLRALRRDGGTIRYNDPAVSVRRMGGGWTVRTAGETSIRARTVIANVPAWDLPGLLGEAATPRLQRAKRLRRQSWGAVVLHLGVDAAVLPEVPHTFAQVLPALGEGLDEGRMVFITILPRRRAGAPRAVSVSTHTDARNWWGLDRTAYEARKAAFTERMLAACDLAYPGLRAGLRFSAAATPRTFAHYTLRGRGLVGGLKNDVRHSLFGSLSHRTGLPGLYLCGDTVFPGQGTIGVTLSGINAWRSAADDLGAAFSAGGIAGQIPARRE